ncbi:TniQ family protein [Ralstonia sp. CHL-2022]|uniref:TniQ family protein n=1 Tax=Ralstonia mojiangensis TaxID=2953895 RepID=UPI0021B29079|nr:TniQ family protein [Ralstonia mojiangensis]MCT7296348.1 TniQ family protein [Ralstonia mojiangensis]
MIESAATALPQYRGETLPSWAMLGPAAQIRYCPACLHDEVYIRERWRLSTFEVCTIHNIRLKNDLVEPAITASYNRPETWKIDEIKPEQMWSGAMCPLPVEQAHVTTIWGAFEAAIVGRCTDSNELLAWTLLSEKILDAVVTSIRGVDYPARDTVRATHRAGWLHKMGASISPSRTGVLQFILKLECGAHQRAAAGCLRKLADDEAREATLLSRLPLQWLHDRLIAASPESRAGVSHGALPRDLHPADHISLDRAETLIGCRASLLYFLVREGFFKSVHSMRHGRKQYTFIHRSDVESCRRWLSQCMSFEQAMSELKVDRRGYWALLDSQLLRPIRLGYQSWHRREDVAALLSKLDQVARVVPRSDADLYPLMGEWMHRRGRSRAVLIRVLLEILHGDLPLYRKLSNDGMAAYFVDVAALERLRKLSAAHKARAAREADDARQLCLL